MIRTAPLAVFLLAGSLGCSESRPPPETPPEGESALGNDPIPADFTFQATRPLALEVAADSGGGEVETAAGQRLRLEVRSRTLGVIYRGSIVAGSTFRFDYPLPADVTQLEIVTIDDSGLERTQSVTVTPDMPGLSVVVGGAP